MNQEFSIDMANEESVAKAARSPRGAKPVMKAFFVALDAVPDSMQSAVAKAAQVMIRDQLKVRRDKLREAAAKEKARKPVAAKAVRGAKAAAPAPAAKAKRRTRKSTDAAAAA